MFPGKHPLWRPLKIESHKPIPSTHCVEMFRIGLICHIWMPLMIIKYIYWFISNLSCTYYSFYYMLHSLINIIDTPPFFFVHFIPSHFLSIIPSVIGYTYSWVRQQHRDILNLPVLEHITLYCIPHGLGIWLTPHYPQGYTSHHRRSILVTCLPI